jgi:hypothetical protein
MKRLVSISMALVLAFGFTFAQEKSSHVVKTQASPHDSTMGKSSDSSMCHGMGGKGKQMMCGGGGMHMMGMEGMEMIMPKVYPTTDGGIIVVSGNMVTKYDGNLNKKKEIFITPNFDSLKSMITKATQYAPKCPMMDTTGKGK